MRASILLLVSLLGAARAAASGDCHVAQEAYAAGDFAAALEQWKALAEDDHAHSQLMIGSLYFSGQGVEQSYREAEHWFRLAAENGSADAALQLAEMYIKGEGVKADARKALHWRTEAATLAERNSGVECHELTGTQFDE